MITISNNNHWLLNQEKIAGENIFLISDGMEYSYSQIAEMSKKAASYFYEIGIRDEGRIPILAENSIEFVVNINALWILNVIPVPLNPKISDDELNSIINHLNPKFIIQSNNKISLMPNDVEVVKFYSTEINNYDSVNNISKFNSESISLMLYTSGSTGTPKCVELTFNNLFASVKAMDAFVSHTVYDVWLASLPLNHIGGLSIILRTMAAGCSVVIPKSFSVENLYEVIRKHKPSLISVVPTIHKRILDSFKYPWGNLKNVFIGGGPVSEELVLSSLKNNWPISIVYGSTETSSMVSIASAENLSAQGFSAGKPLSGVKIFIDKSGTDKTSNEEIGRIVIESESVSKSYYRYEKKNNNLSEGKYYSNDLGKIDKNGNLQVFGRIDDIIISGGENISLNEIENLLSLELDFNHSVCLGIKDDKWGQSYILVTDSQKDNIEDGIYGYLKDRLSNYKLPKQIIKLKKLPISPLGKPLKSEIKKIISADFL